MRLGTNMWNEIAWEALMRSTVLRPKMPTIAAANNLPRSQRGPWMCVAACHPSAGTDSVPAMDELR